MRQIMLVRGSVGFLLKLYPKIAGLRVSFIIEMEILTKNFSPSVK